MTKSDLKAFWTVPKNCPYISKDDNVEYVFLCSVPRRVVNTISSKIQYILWKVGISIHNPISHECTPDFSCCIHKQEKE